MMNNMQRGRRFRQMVIILVLMMAFFGMGSSSITVFGGQRSANNEDEQIRLAVEQLIIVRSDDILSNQYFGIGSITIYQDWATIEIGLRYSDSDEVVGSGPILILSHKQQGEWRAVWQSTEQFYEWLQQAPTNLISSNVKLQYAQPFDMDSSASSATVDTTSSVIYELPWRGGTNLEVLQGNNNPAGSHNGSMLFSYDFGTSPSSLGEGTILYASRDGIVDKVDDYYTACGGVELIDAANYVLIRHVPDDGTADLYLHIQEGSAREFGIENGTRIYRGQPIARLGSTGWTNFDGSGCAPHLHFQQQVYPGNGSYFQQSLEVGFWDPDVINQHSNGIPEAPNEYNSDNYPLIKQLKVFSTWLTAPPTWDWPYLFEADDLWSSTSGQSNRVRGFTVDGSSFYSFEGCVENWANLSSGDHLITYWYESRGEDYPSIDTQAWPTIPQACAGEITNPPTEMPATYNVAIFISDITLPDGSIISPGQSLTKIWRMKNTGSTTWGSGYELVFVNGDQLGAPATVGVPNTAPGQEVDLSVNLTAPSSSGRHVGYWQLRDPQGIFFGPQIWVSIIVQSDSQLPPGSNLTLTTDPSSPADASSVAIHAQAINVPNFRAMRLKIDGNVVYELGAPEFTYNWNTTGYNIGDHSIVLEAADQTDTSWSHPEQYAMIFTLTGTGVPLNHAPNRPDASSPYDWYVYYSGNTATLCANANGDPDGDSITGYYFETFDSAQLWNSGWVGTSCTTTSALGPYNYQWRVKVRDSGNAESDWSIPWHFTLVNSSLSITELYFEPQDGSYEQVKIRACTTGQGGVGITMRVSVNDANDGSDSGEWHIIKELGVPCFNAIDAPLWNTLEYGDGTHLVRVEAHGQDVSWDGAAVREEPYFLPHRRPNSLQLVAPVPASGSVIYLDSRTVTFMWGDTLRADNYTLYVSTNPSPKDDPSPIFQQTFASTITEHTVILDQDHDNLYWQVVASNDVGSNASTQQFGIDRQSPTCTVQTLSATTYENTFQIDWSGTDNLSGIYSFDIQYKDSNRGTWSDWLTGVSSDKVYELFAGQLGHSYSFRCRATDNANNIGSYPGSADTSTLIDPSSRPPTPWWDTGYDSKHNITILNNMAGIALPTGYPVHLQLDGSTTPTAAEVYNASLTSPKCNDLRIVYNDITELDRVVQSCSSSTIDIWFRTQTSVPAGSSDGTSHQLYYGNVGAGSPLANPNNVWQPGSDANTLAFIAMQDGSGNTASDLSSYGNDCSFDSSIIQWTTGGKFGAYSLDFPNPPDGPSLVCGSNGLNVSAFTLETWINYETGGWFAGNLTDGNAQERWVWRIVEGKSQLMIWEGGGSSTASADTGIPKNSWHHIAVTFDGTNQVNFYLDGNLLPIKTSLSSSGIRSLTQPLRIGSVQWGGRLKGKLAFFKVSSGVKTSFPYASFAAITNEPSLAAGSLIEPPIIGSPDLAILSLSTYPTTIDGVLVEVVVQNQGNVSTQNGIFTDLYIDHLPTGAGDYVGSVSFWVSDPIAPDETATLTTVLTDLGGTVPSPGGEITGTLYAQTDSAGTITEPDKNNNIFSSGTEICLAAPDAYEDDDTFGTATTISAGQIQTHNLNALGDEDWFSFNTPAGTMYRLRTFNLDVSADTSIYVYDIDGITLLASNDDYNDSLASQLDWVAPTSGTYYILVKHWNPNVGGCGTTYSVELSDVNVWPSNPSNLFSTSHATNQTASDNTIDVSWSDDATDLSGTGLDGYSTSWDSNPNTQPNNIIEHTAQVLSETSPTLADGTWYFHLRTCDNAGNCAEAIHLGPFIIDTTPIVTCNTWGQATPNTSPPNRYAHDLAFDAARNKTVLFGGYSGGYFNDTWEFDGTNWSQIFPTISPGSRDWTRMTFDSTRNRIVLFGGHNTGQNPKYLSDTWVYNGTTWTQLSPATVPPGRHTHAIAYDSIRDRLVMFGGESSSGRLNDTWEFDGTNWVQVSTAQSPPARQQHRMVFDSQRGVIVLYGGHGTDGFNDTWEYDGTNWTQITTAHVPNARSVIAMAYDQQRQITVLFGGWYSGQSYNQTWEYDGTDWTEVATISQPSPLNNTAGAGLTYDSLNKTAVLFADGETWEYCQSASANNPPVANKDNVTTDEDAAITINVLVNDGDTDGDTLNVDSYTQPLNGLVESTVNGIVTYTPDANFNGNDSFTYTISDGNSGSDTATVNVIVDPVNDPPYSPSTPTPSSDATGVSNFTSLSWIGGDLDVGDTITYDAYLDIGSSVPTTLVCDDITSTTCVLSRNLTENTTYSWQVIASDGTLTTSSPVWEFQTDTLCSSITEIPQSECGALLTLYNETGGVNWATSTNWLETMTPCSWYGVSCDGGHVSGLGLSANNLIGSIPSEVGILTSLISLDLSGNRLHGTLPAIFSGLSSLETLWLQNNALSGSIPDITNLISLTDTDLSYNALVASGVIESFLNSVDPDWKDTQTSSPSNLIAMSETSSSIELSWTNILYTGDGGYYEISYATKSDGPWTVAGTTADKLTSTFTIAGLRAEKVYYTRVRAFTPSHGVQLNSLFSEYTTSVLIRTESIYTYGKTDEITPILTQLENGDYQVELIVTGTYPIACGGRTIIEQEIIGQDITVIFKQKVRSNKACSATEKPFKLTILLEGTYDGGTTWYLHINDNDVEITIP